MRGDADKELTRRLRLAALLAIFAVSALILGSCGLTLAGAGEGPAASAFDTARVRFEQNATDGDVEVVFEAKGEDEGLASLTIVGPGGRTFLDLKAPDASTLGLREFAFESPEPKDVAGLKAAYPEGTYTFSGATASGEKFHGESVLSHALPATVKFVSPAAEADGVSVAGLEIAWTPAPDAAGYVVEIENDDLEVGFVAELGGETSKLGVPAGFVVAGTEYELAIGTVAASGNISFVETSFSTEK